jgi:erythromycin esterase
MSQSPTPGAVREQVTPIDALHHGPSRDGDADEHRSPEQLAGALSGLVGFDGQTGEGPVVVGLGETTHGTRECFRTKAGLIRLLVERGVRTVAFEADVTATRPLDAYVRHGEGDPVTALGGLHKWMWQVESVRDLLVWLRSFNRDRPADDRVRVRGVDLSHPAAPADHLRSYFEAADPNWAETSAALDTLAALAGRDVPGDASARERTLEAAESAAAALGQRLDSGRAAYIDAAGERRWERARHDCRVVERACDWHRVRHEQPGPHAAGMQQRDRYMAENVAWCARQDPGSGVAVWAHNSHVKRGSFDDGRVWTDATGMGEFLAREFGDRYTPVGFDVAGGSFRAVEAGNSDRGPQRFTFGAPPEGSATALFERVGGAPWLLDVRAAAADSRLGDWVDRPQRMRCVGTVYDPDTPDDHYLRTPLTSFDALAFLDRSTPSCPVTSGGDS